MRKHRKTKWKTTAIPGDLYQKIEKVAQAHGYTSVSRFVEDSCRRRIEQLEKAKFLEVPA